MVNNDNNYYYCVVCSECVYTKSPKCDWLHFINKSKWLDVDFSFGIWNCGRADYLRKQCPVMKWAHSSDITSLLSVFRHSLQ